MCPDGDEDDGNDDGDDDEDDHDDECTDERPRFCSNVPRWKCKRNKKVQNICKKTCKMCSDGDDDEEECKDEWWCGPVPSFKCRWHVVKNSCKQSCGLCDKNDHEYDGETCKDTSPGFCARNGWKCWFSKHVQRKCAKTCNRC